MPHVETFVKTQRIVCMKRYVDGYKSTWKVFLDNYLSDFGGSFLLKCNYDVKFLPKTLPKFYKECLSAWAAYKSRQITTHSDVLNEIILNNRFICVGGKPLFRNKIIKKCKTKLCDVLSDEGKLQSWNTLENKNLTASEYFLLISVFDSIPPEWKNLLKGQLQNPIVNNISQDVPFPSTSTVLYWNLINKVESPPTSQRKYEETFPTVHLPWQKIYLLPRSVTLDSITREFQYKFLNRIIYTSKALYKMGIVSSPTCTFCRKSEESLEHLFIYCEFSRDFWLSVTLWLKDFFKDLDVLNATNIIFGFFTEDYLLLNHILIICKQVIFQCRNRNIKPSLSLLKVKLKYVYKLECSITKQKDSLETRQKKWKKLLPLLIEKILFVI